MIKNTIGKYFAHFFTASNSKTYLLLVNINILLVFAFIATMVTIPGTLLYNLLYGAMILSFVIEISFAGYLTYRAHKNGEIERSLQG